MVLAVVGRGLHGRPVSLLVHLPELAVGGDLVSAVGGVAAQAAAGFSPDLERLFAVREPGIDGADASDIVQDLGKGGLGVGSGRTSKGRRR